MATATLPGLSLPGLGLSSTPSGSAVGTASSGYQPPSRQEDLAPRTEWRFEVNFQQHYTVRLLSGHAEIFGAELTANHDYNFSGCKEAVFTWQGCRLEISGEAESEYVGQETEYAIEWLNVHGMLETARDDAQVQGDGPRVLVVGPDSVGKSSLVTSLAGWPVKCGRMPTIVNVDPREGLLAPPGSITAVTVGSQMDVENGYGITPISGPTTTPIKTPLVYHYPYSSPVERPEVYKALITRTALSVTNKLEEDVKAKQCGIIVDTPGSLNDPRTNYDQISHLVSEFSITLILTIGSERLFSDMNRRFGGGAGSMPQREDAVSILRISKPGGAVERDTTFTKALQHRQIRQYFFGNSRDSLNPHSHTLNFSDITVYRANSSALAASGSGMDSEDVELVEASAYAAAQRPSSSSSPDFEKVSPTNEMLGRLVAIKFCPGESDDVTIRDSAVMGFAYVSEVDESKKKVRFLAPHPQRWGDRALVYGGWPEAVADLVG